MTVLIIGGAAQGKKTLAMRLYGLAPDDFADGRTCTREGLASARAIDGLHHLTRREKDLSGLVGQLRGKLVLCDEIGCGVVPADREQDDWRERTGRRLCDRAAQADTVIRVCAGLPQVLKGALPDAAGREG